MSEGKLKLTDISLSGQSWRTISICPAADCSNYPADAGLLFAEQKATARQLCEIYGLMDQVMHYLRPHHYVYSTEQTYMEWICRYIRFYNMKHPREMGEAEIENFLTYLAVERNVAGATQNQALNALVFQSFEISPAG